MVNDSTGEGKATFSTMGTVSAPIELQAKGEHTAVQVDRGKGKRKISPKVKVTLTSLTPNNVGTLRRLNSVVLPIVYSDKFYKDVLDPSLDDINKLSKSDVYYLDIPVGAVCCRIDNPTSTNKDKPPTLVILTLSVLAPYRSLGLGTALLKSALAAALHPTAPPPPIPSDTKPNTRASLTVAPPRKSITRAMVHVQVGNDAAKRFYEAWGFKVSETIDEYYSKMEPRAAHLMVCEDILAVVGGGANGSA